MKLWVAIGQHTLPKKNWLQDPNYLVSLHAGSKMTFFFSIFIVQDPNNSLLFLRVCDPLLVSEINRSKWKSKPIFLNPMWWSQNTGILRCIKLRKCYNYSFHKVHMRITPWLSWALLVFPFNLIIIFVVFHLWQILWHFFPTQEMIDEIPTKVHKSYVPLHKRQIVIRAP